MDLTLSSDSVLTRSYTRLNLSNLPGIRRIKGRMSSQPRCFSTLGHINIDSARSADKECRHNEKKNDVMVKSDVGEYHVDSTEGYRNTTVF